MARCVILVIWLVAGLLFVPTLVVQQQQPLKLLGNIGNNFFFSLLTHIHSHILYFYDFESFMILEMTLKVSFFYVQGATLF